MNHCSSRCILEYVSFPPATELVDAEQIVFVVPGEQISPQLFSRTRGFDRHVG